MGRIGKRAQFSADRRQRGPQTAEAPRRALGQTVEPPLGWQRQGCSASSDRGRGGSPVSPEETTGEHRRECPSRHSGQPDESPCQGQEQEDQDFTAQEAASLGKFLRLRSSARRSSAVCARRGDVSGQASTGVRKRNRACATPPRRSAARLAPPPRVRSSLPSPAE